ncbi:MAG: Nmad5 family putative nucleotide modification protein [Plesiomonas shigelloides]
MTRLTKQVKEQIVAAAVAKSVGERPVTLENTRYAWLKKVAEYSIEQSGISPAELFKTVDKIKKLTSSVPTQLKSYYSFSLNTDRTLCLNIAGMSINVDVPDGEPQIVCAENYSNRRIAIPADHQLAKEWDVIHQEELRIKEIQDTVRVNVTAMVNSVTTIKKLIDVWPECVELIPEQVNKPVVNLPTIKVDQLNTMIGIPSQE